MEESETSQKLISIIIATYNCGRKIQNTLESIFSQNKDLFELIVLDGSSTDDTLDFLKNHERDLTLISEKDTGIYDAFNKGIDLANGKYLYFIGAGDCLRPDILERIKNFLLRETPSVIYGKVYFVKQNSFNGQEFTDTLFIRDNLCQQGIFYHREVFNIIGKFDLRYKVFADWLFNVKCFTHKEINKFFIDFIIADYEGGGVSSNIENDPSFKKDFPLYIRQQFGFFKSLICRTFLAEPYVFNIIYFSNYHLLREHLISSYSFFGYVASLLRPTARKYRSLKKSFFTIKFK